MCIIVLSKKGIRQPSFDTLSICFKNNPDGAGYMYARDGKVIIHKGFMSFNDFKRAVTAENFTDNDVVVYHFRISTQAGITPYMTHPFPLTSDLLKTRELDVTCPCGLAHNGIISLTTTIGTQYSDTALFITRYAPKLLRKRSDLKDGVIRELFERLTGSKWAIINGDGDVMTVGNFIEDFDGVLYSNFTFNNIYYKGAIK